MKVKLYKLWISNVSYYFQTHYLYNEDNGKYILARRIWRYHINHPNGAQWIKDIRIKFILKYKK